MKKWFTITALVLVMSALLAGCGGKFTCGACGQEKEGGKKESVIVDKEVIYCDECYEKAEQAAELLGVDLDDYFDSLDELADTFG